nr:reversion-inducing cysteine-rich protein with Kazal motifs-like isoform X1 [Dromaius novaehollandiae]
MTLTATLWPWALPCLAAAALLCPRAAGLSCCYHAKDNLMCRDVCEQILSSKSDSRLKHLLQRAPEYCPESMEEVWGCINSSLPDNELTVQSIIKDEVQTCCISAAKSNTREKRQIYYVACHFFPKP